MEPINPRPSKIRKRANKACLACRARKVRCDVSQRGRPCMNCFLDNEACVVVGRASRRRKSTEGDAATGDVPPEDAIPDRHGSSELRAEGVDDQGDGDIPMDETSDAGIYEQRASNEREAVRCSTSGFSAVNAPSARLSYTQAADHISPYASTNGAQKHDAAHQHRHTVTKAGPQQLQWAGEQSTLFGVDVLYSYYPFLDVRNIQNVLSQDVSYLEMQGCFRVPTRTILDDFVKQYFLHVHPMLPLINEGDFWELYGPAPADGDHRTKLSLLLFQAMLFASCAYVPRSRIRALGYADMKTARAALYRRAKLLYDFGAESSPIAISQAALLLSSWSPSGSHCSQTGSFWLSIAIQQARVSGAHHYTTLYGNLASEPQSPEDLKWRNSLKRLWWSIILTDRIFSLCSWTPVQLSRLHLHPDLDPRCPFNLADFGDEIERSRVYNPGAKRALIELFIMMTDLAALLTELLTEALPIDEGSHWDHTLGDQEKDRIEECKKRLNLWYDRASGTLPFPPRSLLEAQNAANQAEYAAVYAHDSAALYTNYLCLLYQSAMTRLCHHECLRMVAQVRRADPTGPTLPLKRDLVGKHRETQNAALGVVECLKKLTTGRLSRWLPLHTTSCVSLSLILSIIDVKLSRHSGQTANLLHGLYESVRAYHPQLDTTDFVSDTVRKILDLSSLNRPSTFNEAASASGDIEDPHPSLYLRMAMASAPQFERGGFLGDTSHVDVGLLRLFGPALMSQINLLLSSESPAATASTPAAQPAAAPNAYPSLNNDDQVKRHIAAWAAMDHALSSELDIVSPPDLTTADGARNSSDVANAESGHKTAASASNSSLAVRREISNRAFSVIGDAREADFLDAFAFKDQAGGTGAGPVDWAAPDSGAGAEETHGGAVAAVDGEVGSGIPPEAVAQERRDVELARLESPEQFWNELFQQMKPGGVVP